MSDFENIDYKLTRQQLKQRIQIAIKKAEKLPGNHYYKTTCRRFLNCIEPEKIPGDNPLPLIAGPSNRCHARNKYNCLLFRISYILQGFHKLTPTNPLTIMELKGRLNRFEKIINKGLGKFKIMGTKYPGYYLVEK